MRRSRVRRMLATGAPVAWLLGLPGPTGARAEGKLAGVTEYETMTRRFADAEEADQQGRHTLALALFEEVWVGLREPRTLLSTRLSRPDVSTEQRRLASDYLTLVDYTAAITAGRLAHLGRTEADLVCEGHRLADSAHARLGSVHKWKTAAPRLRDQLDQVRPQLDAACLAVTRAPDPAGSSVWPWVATAATGALAGTGLVFNLLARDDLVERDRAFERYRAAPDEQSASVQETSALGFHESAESRATISYAFFGLAALAGGWAVWSFMSDDDAAAAVSVSVGAAPGCLVLGVRW